VGVRGIHHVGVVVADLDEAVETYRRLFGAALERRERLDDDGVDVAAMRLGDGLVELVAPVGDDTPVARFLANRGPGMHHVAYAVDDVRGTLASLAGEGAQLIDESPRIGLFGLEVAFVHPESDHGVLVEVVSNAG
jgi:methylmalonyl-CoA epimerase